MKKLLFGGLLCLAAPFLSFGQVCAVDPLNNTSWAFSIHTPSGGIAAIGTFRATNIGGQQNVTGVQTVNNNGQISRQESFSGRYTLDGDCRGGEILISVGRASAQLQFYFANGGLEMEIVSDSTNYYLSPAITLGRLASTIFGRNANVTFTGLARKLVPGPLACPGGNPLSILNNTSYGFRTSNFGGVNLNLPGITFFAPSDTAVAGIFDATAVNNGFGLSGVLAVTETISADGLAPAQIPLAAFASPSNRGGVFRGIKTGGRYIINPDCSGGEIMIMSNFQPIQYEFVFAANDLSQMFLLSDSEGYMLQGVAKKY